MEHPIGQSSFSAFAYDVQYSFGISRHEYLPVIFRRNHLSSFAMCRAFPGSDYYEDSVTIGISPRRPSRVPFDFGDGGSASFHVHLPEEYCHKDGDEVLVLRLRDEPGALAQVAEKLKQAGVNIQSMHILNRHGGYAMIALTTNDRACTLEAIGSGTVV